MTVSSSSHHLPNTSTPRLVSSSSASASSSSSSFSGRPSKTIPSTEAQDSYDKTIITSAGEEMHQSSLNVKGDPRCLSKDLQLSPDKEESSSSSSLHWKDVLKDSSHPTNDEQQQDEDLIKGIGETASLVLQDMKSWIASQIQANLLPPTRSITTCTPSTHPSSSSRLSSTVDSSSFCSAAYPHASTKAQLRSAQQESFLQLSQKPQPSTTISGGTKLNSYSSSSCMSSSPSFQKTEIQRNASFLESVHSRQKLQSEGRPPHDPRQSLSSHLYLQQRDEPLSEDWTFKPEGIFSSFLSLFDVEEDPQNPDATRQASSLHPPPPRGFPGQPAIVGSFLEPSSSSFRRPLQHRHHLDHPVLSSSSSSFLHSKARLSRCCDRDSSFSQEQPYSPPSFLHPPSTSSSSSSSSCLASLSRQERPPQETSYPSYPNTSSRQQRLGTILSSSSSSLSSSTTSLHLSQSLTTPRSLAIPGAVTLNSAEKEGTLLTSRTSSSFRDAHRLTTTQSIETAGDSRTHLSKKKTSLHHHLHQALPSSSSSSFVSPHLDGFGGAAGAGGASMFLLSPESIEEPADGLVKPQTWLADLASPATQQYAQRSHIELSLLKLHNIGKPISSSVISGPVK